MSLPKFLSEDSSGFDEGVIAVRFGQKQVAERRELNQPSAIMVGGFEMNRTDHMNYEMNLVREHYKDDKIIVIDFSERVIGSTSISFYSDRCIESMIEHLANNQTVYIRKGRLMGNESDDRFITRTLSICKALEEFIREKNEARMHPVKAWVYFIGFTNRSNDAHSSLVQPSKKQEEDKLSKMMTALFYSLPAKNIIPTLDVSKFTEWSNEVYKTARVAFLPNVRVQEEWALRAFAVNKEDFQHCYVVNGSAYEITGYDTHY